MLFAASSGSLRFKIGLMGSSNCRQQLHPNKAVKQSIQAKQSRKATMSGSRVHMRLAPVDIGRSLHSGRLHCSTRRSCNRCWSHRNEQLWASKSYNHSRKHSACNQTEPRGAPIPAQRLRHTCTRASYRDRCSMKIKDVPTACVCACVRVCA